VLGEKVGLTGATIDASGTTGGGEILLGGNFQGHGPERNATATFVGSDVTLKADATQNGNGGKIVVWADGITRFYGDISAQGGILGGDGGRTEVSGKRTLDFDGTANTLAPRGRTGSLLLDPDTIVIQSTNGNTMSTNIVFSDNPNNQTIRNTVINGAMSNVVLQANNTIVINADAPLNIANGGTSITLQAGGTITLNAGITTNNGAISITANDAGGTQTGTGAITIAGGATLNSGTASTTLSGASISIGAGITSGTLMLTGTGSGTPVAINAVLNAASVNVTGAATVGANITTTGASGVVFNNAATISGNRTINTSAGNGPITFSSTLGGTTNATDDLTLNAGAGGNIAVTGAVGTSILRLGDVSITNANNVTFSNNVFVGTLTQVAGQGTTTLTGALNAADATSGGNISLTGNNFAFSGGVTTTEGASNAGGGLTIDSAGATVIATGAIDLGGAFLFTGAGTGDIRSNITVLSSAGAADGITFSNGNTLTLGGTSVAFTVNTGGSATRGGAITFTDMTVIGLDVNGTNLTLAANAIELPTSPFFTDGTGNSTTFTIRGAANGTTIDLGVGGGSGTLLLSAAELGSFFDGNSQIFGSILIGGASQTGTITLGNAAFSDPVTIQAGGAGGTITLSSGAILSGANNSAGLSPVTLSATTINLNGTVRTNASTISITGTGLVTDGAAFAADTTNGGGAAAGASITYTGTINGNAGAGNEQVFFAAGTSGNVMVSGAAGTSQALDRFQVTNANNTTIQAVTATTIAITPGAASGVVTANGLLSASAAATNSVVINATTINILGGITTTSGSGDSAILIAASTLLNVGGNISAQGSFTNNGAGAVQLGGSINTSGGSVGNRNISFNAGSYSVLANTATLSLNAGTGTISFANANAGTALNISGRALTLQANALSFSGNNSVIGNGTGSLTLLGATNATSIGVGTGASGTFVITNANLTAIADEAAATINIGSTSQTANISFLASTFHDALVATTGAAGTINVGGNITADQADAPITLTGGTISLGANIRSTGTAIVLQGPSAGNALITLSGATIIDTTNSGAAAGGAAITLTGTVNGAQALTFNAGNTAASDITVTGAIGGTTRIGALTITDADAVSFQGAVTAASVQQVAGDTGTSATTFSGLVNTNGLISASSNGVSLNGRSFTINGITTTGTGGVAIASSTGGVITLQTTALTLDGTFAKTGLGTTTLGVDITTTNDNIDFTGGNTTLSATGHMLAAGTGTITLNNGLALQTFTLTLSANGIDFLGGANSVTGTSSASALCLFGATGATTIGVASGSGTLNLSQTDLLAVATSVGELQLGASAGTGLITVLGPPSPVVVNNTVRFRSAADVQTSLSLPGSGCIIFASTATVSADLTASCITFGGAATLNGNIALTATNTANTGPNTGITFASTVATGQGIGDNLTLSGNLLQFNGGANTVSGSGDGGLIVTPVTTATSIGVAGGAGTLQLTQAFFAAMVPGTFNLTTIGASAGTHAITIAGGTFAAGPVIFQAPGTGGTINISSAMTGSGTTSFDFIADTAAASNTFPITLGGGITTANQNITFQGNTTFTAASATLGAGTSTIAFNNLLRINTNALTLSANGIDFLGGANSVTGTSSASALCLFGATGATTIGVASGSGTLNLSQTDLLAVATSVGELQLGASAGTGLITLLGPPSPYTFNTTVNFRGPSSLLTTVNLSGTNCLIFGGDAVVSGNLSASCIMFNGNATLNGPITLVATNTSSNAGDATGIRFAGNVITNQGMSEDLALSANLIQFNGGANTVSGTGNGTLTLAPLATSDSIGLAGGAGTLQLNQALFSAMQNGAFSQVTVGTASGTHAITIAGGTYQVPLLVQAPGVGGTIDITGNLTGTGGGSFRFLADPAAATFPITLAGNITTANQSISFAGNTLLDTGAITLNTGTDTVRFEQLLDIQGTNLTIRSNTISFLGGNNSVTGNGMGTLTLLGATDATSIGVGGASGTAQISTGTLDALADEATGQIVIGSTAQAADIGVSASAFRDSLTILTDVTHTLTTFGQLTGAQPDASITLRAGAIFLGGSIITDGAAISLQSTTTPAAAVIRLTSNVTLDSTNAGGSAGGANVLVDGSVNGTTAGIQTFTINAGTGGLATLSGNSGGSIALGAVDVTGGGGIVLGGNIITQDATVRLRNDVTLANDLTIDTTGLGAMGVLGQNITFDGTINSDGTPRGLTLNGGGAGVITVAGSIGGTNALTTFSATGDQLITSIFVSDVTTTGAQTYNGWLSTGDTLTVLNTGAGITVNGNVQLEDNGTDNTVRFVTAGAASSDLIMISGFVDSDMLAGVPPSLVLNAGSMGSVTLSSAAGSGGPILGSFTATGATISVTNVATTQTQTYNGNLTLEGINSNPGQLDANGSSDIIINGSVTLNHARDIIAGNLIRVTGTIDSASGQFFALLLNAPTVNLLGSVGTADANALGSLNVNGAGTLTLGNPAVNNLYFVRTQGGFTTGHAITLAQSAVFNSLNGGTMQFTSIDSDAMAARALSINNSGDTTISGAIGGSQSLSTFATDAGGMTTLGGNVTTTTSQTFGDNVVITTDVIFNAGNAAAFGGRLETDGSPRSATVNASSTASFAGTVGANGNKLNVFNVTAPTITLVGVTTSGAQVYTGNATMSGAYATDNAGITITGNETLADGGSIFATGGSVLITGNTITGNNTTIRSSGGNVALSGTLTLNGDTTLQTDGNSGSEDVNVAGAVNSATTSHSLIAIAGGSGDVIFGGDIGLGVGAGQVALSNLTATGATIALANVRTIGGQSYAASTATTLNGDLSSTGAGTIVFSGPLRLAKSGATSIVTQSGSVQFGAIDAASAGTPSGLNVSAGGAGNEVIFAGSIGTTQALSTLTSSGTTRLNGGFVNTTGAQSYGALTLNSSLASTTSLFATGYTFGGAINGSGQTLNLDFVAANGIADFQSTVGAAGALQRLVVGGNTSNRNFDDTSTSRFGGNMTFSGGADIRGTTIITNNITIQGGQGALLFRGTVDADSAASNRSLTLLSQRDASADFIPFGFGRSIGSVARLGTFNLGANRAANLAQQTASAVFSDGFDDAGRISLSSFASSDSFSISTGTGGFTMGRGEKITAFGALTINSTGRVRLGDLTSLVALRVNADNIDLLYRDPSPLATRGYIAGGANGTPARDMGLDFVARDNISFRAANTTGSPNVNIVDIDNRGNTGPDLVNFAVDGGRPMDTVGVLNRFRFFDLTTSSDIGANGLSTAQFSDPRGGGANFLLGLDINAQGTVNAPIASSIAGAIPRDTETRQVATPVTVGKALREQLQDLGLNTRELSFEESVEFLVGRSIYRDADLSRRGNDSGSLVTVNRLAGPPVQEVVDAYLDLIKVAQTDPTTGAPVLDENGKPVLVSREDTIKYDLGTSWTKYAETTDSPDGLGFRMWLEGLGSQADQTDRDSLEFLNKARVVIEKLDTLGLSPYEVRTPTLNVLGRIQPPEISKIEDMEYAVIGKVVSLK
jgi:hypothetical protein